MITLPRARRALGAVVVAALAFLAPRASSAQYYAGFTYNLSFPTGDLQKFTDNESWLGFTFDGRRMKGPWGIGLTAGYNEFHTSTTDQIELGNNGGAVSGEQYRHVLSFPMLIAADYFPRLARGVQGPQPYLGLGAGTYYIRQRFEIGSVAFEEDNWHFGFMPELGVAVPTGSGRMLTLSARYHIPVNGGTYLGGDSRSYQSVSIGVGFSYLKF
jgi:hypothetical protein